MDGPFSPVASGTLPPTPILGPPWPLPLPPWLHWTGPIAYDSAFKKTPTPQSLQPPSGQEGASC